MRIDQSGNVGIGSTSPRGALDLGTGKIYGDGSQLTNLSGSGWTTGTGKVYTTTSTDNVGIGTTSPNTLLTLGGGSPFISVDTTDGADSKRLVLTGGGTYNTSRGAYIDLEGNEYAGGSAGSIFFGAGNVATGDINMGTGSNAYSVVIKNNGNVGIGTTTPTGSLEVVGTGSVVARFNSTAANGGVISYQRSGTAILDIGTGLGLLGVGTNNDVAVYATSRMYLGADGVQFVTLRNSNVGIGTTVPSVKLDISDPSLGMMRLTTTGASGSSLIRVQNDSGAFGDYKIDGSSVAGTLWGLNRAGLVQILSNAAPFAIGTLGAYDLTFGTNNAASMTIKSGGNVGIGTTAPVGLLDVNRKLTVLSNGYVGIGMTIPDTKLSIYAGVPSDAQWGQQSVIDNRTYNTSGLGGKISLGATYNSSGGYTYLASIAGLKENSTDGNFAGALAFYVRQNGSPVGEGMRISSSGNVGIGTTAPGRKLEISDAAAAYLRLSDSDSPAYSLELFGGNSGVAYPSINTGIFSQLDLGTQGAVAMTLKSGNVGIGTTVPAKKLEVKGGDIYINQVSSQLIMKKPDGTCASCGPNNSDIWVCTGVACP